MGGGGGASNEKIHDAWNGCRAVNTTDYETSKNVHRDSKNDVLKLEKKN